MHPTNKRNGFAKKPDIVGKAKVYESKKLRYVMKSLLY